VSQSPQSTFDPGAESSARVPLLPERPGRLSPITRRLLLRRTALPLLTCVATGTTLVMFGGPSLQALGLSLVVPGGGLLFGGHPFLFLATCALMGIALVLWWGVSAILAPLAVVILGAVLAAALAPSEAGAWDAAVPVVYAILVLLVGTAVARFERAYRVKLRAIPAVNSYLATAELPRRTRAVRETNDLDAAALAFLLDLALQPLDELEGFDHGEQFHGGTCLRYQLTMIGSALAVANANLLPNFPGLMEQAQRNIVLKQTDIRTWRYWQVENFLGRLSLNPDPIVRDNIMFSGFLASQVGEYEAATGSDYFDRPGSLTFTWRDGRAFVYDHHTLAEAVSRNFRSSRLGLFACEPGWVFTVCNAMAAQGLKSYELAHAGSLWREAEHGWKTGTFTEMMTADGGIRHMRSSWFGFTFNDGDGTGEYFVSGSHNFEDTAPAMARRGALLQMRGVAEKLAALEGLIDTDGRLGFPVSAKPERGTRYLSSLTERLGLVAGAMAVGNDRVAAAAEHSLYETCGTGASFPDKPLDGGVMMTAALMSIVWGTPMTIADMARRGYEPPVGPILEHAPWPALVVTEARSPDGERLELALRPHRATPGEVHELRVAVGAPGRRLRITGEGVDLDATAEADGRVHIAVPVPGPLRLTLTPIAGGAT
jgi:hypothetical protein